jgi:pimeloyl-ACP methyl ester carboxylesterase
VRQYVRRTGGRFVAVTATVLAVGSMGVAVADATPESGRSGRQGVNWQPCPSYSDDTLRMMFGGDTDRIAAFRQLWARAECGTVSVPLDYANPGGRRITVALTRLKAVDQAHRLGSLAFNPGGPGGSGYLMPFDVVLENSTNRRLNDRYDLIGFDPRGVGYSTKIDCPRPAPPPDGGPPQPGPVTEAFARQVYADQLRDNQACSTSDPAFLRGLTTANVARDLDQIRAALHDRKLSFLGVSWGTWLGVLYRNLFPDKVDRMWLDSTAIPNFRLDAFEQGRAAATARDFSRMAAWMAQHHDTYGFGTSEAQVKAALVQLLRSYDANPRQFTDLPRPVDGSVIGISGAQPSPVWPVAAQVLKELRDATGPTAPPTVKQVLGGGDGPDPGPPPADAPVLFNDTMNRAVFCNEDTGPRDFDSAWTAYQRRLSDFPVTGRISGFTPGCQGWTLPPQPVRLHRDGGSLVMSGHRYESVSVYEWTIQMRQAIGGTVFTVEDDVHGSVLRVAECAAKLVAYFETGNPGARGCRGAPGPDDPAAAPASPSFEKTTMFA